VEGVRGIGGPYIKEVSLSDGRQRNTVQGKNLERGKGVGGLHSESVDEETCSRIWALERGCSCRDREPTKRGHSLTLLCTLQYSTAYYSTILYCTASYSTVQYSEASEGY